MNNFPIHSKIRASSRICVITIDIEEDLGRSTYLGVENLDPVVRLLDDFGISATLFATGEALYRYPYQLAQYSLKHEIACHGYDHVPLSRLPLPERRRQLVNFCSLYDSIIGTRLEGFRATQHSIDADQLNLLEELGFSYDSSVIPKYLPFRKYAGYKGRAPGIPYHPDYSDYRQHGNRTILEIPNSPLIMGFPFCGTYLRFFNRFYHSLLGIRQPQFLMLVMHSWDAARFTGSYSRNSGEAFYKFLKEIIISLNKHHYSFASCRQIVQINQPDVALSLQAATRPAAYKKVRSPVSNIFIKD